MRHVQRPTQDARARPKDWPRTSLPRTEFTFERRALRLFIQIVLHTHPASPGAQSLPCARPHSQHATDRSKTYTAAHTNTHSHSTLSLSHTLSSTIWREAHTSLIMTHHSQAGDAAAGRIQAAARRARAARLIYLLRTSIALQAAILIQAGARRMLTRRHGLRVKLHELLAEVASHIQQDPPKA